MLKITKVEKKVKSFMPHDPKDIKRSARIYISPVGENLWDNLERRKGRPYNVWKKEILPLLPKYVPELKGYKFRWSQKAGCACPCSPGFIAVDGPTKFNVWVTVEWSDKQDVVDPEKEVKLIPKEDKIATSHLLPWSLRSSERNKQKPHR